MKVFKKVSLLFLIVAFTFSACENEPIDGDFTLTTNDPFIPDNNNGGGDPGGDSTGDYWPLAVNNEWNYKYFIDGAAQDDYAMNIVSNVTYQGESVFKFDQYLPTATGSDGTQFDGIEIDTYSRKNGGDYYVIVGDLNASYLDGAFELSQTGYSLLILKDYVATGTVWTQNAQTVTTFTSNDPTFPDLPTITNNLVNTIEIVAKGISVSVNGTTYNDVIKVKYNQETSTPAAPDQTTSSQFFYYFAKDVGLVKAEGTSSDNADNIVSTTLQELDTYTLN